MQTPRAADPSGFERPAALAFVRPVISPVLKGRKPLTGSAWADDGRAATGMGDI
jgi:hypothetical protein